MNEMRPEATRAGSGTSVTAGGVPGTRRIATGLLRMSPLILTAMSQSIWLAALAQSPKPLVTAHLDWYTFFDAGRKFVRGEIASIYPHAFTTYFWVYPPYCIYLTAPLGVLTEPWAYVLCAVAQAVAIVAALLLIRAVLPAPSSTHVGAFAVVLASMPFNMVVILGQPTGIFVLALAAALWTFSKGYPLMAGLSLSFLATKPPLAIGLAFFFLVARQWRVLAGLGIGFAVLLASSVPLGLERWSEYRSTTQRYLDLVQTDLPMWKQVTMYAFWRTLPGLARLSERERFVLWFGSITPLLVAACAAWDRARRMSAPPWPRLFGLGVLVTIAANYYVFYYDSLLLLFPGLAWYLQSDRYRSRTCHRLVGITILSVFVIGYVSVYLVQGGVAWTGPVLAFWLLAEAWDLFGLSPGDVTIAPNREAGGRGGHAALRPHTVALGTPAS